MKTPISYYGGKQQLAKCIISLMPTHSIYVEPFFGGGAVYWAKDPVKCEVVNDVNMNIVNFYEVLKHEYFNLRKRVEATLHSRDLYKKALLIYSTPELFAEDPVLRAWAFWVVTNQGFSGKVGSWGYDKGNRSITIQNKIDDFQENLSERMRYTQIECNLASKVIESRDSDSTFFYVDPPYINTNQGHYSGYSEDDFKKDLDTLCKVTGKFILSSFNSDILTKYTKENQWHQIIIEKPYSAAKVLNSGKRPKKYEVLTANYPITLKDSK